MRTGGEEFAAVIPPWPLETAAELFGRADAALHEAKQSGRNCTVAAP